MPIIPAFVTFVFQQKLMADISVVITCLKFGKLRQPNLANPKNQ